MKKTLVLVAVLLLTSSLAWAEGTPGGAAAPEAVNPATPTPVDGSCTLPGLRGPVAGSTGGGGLGGGIPDV